MNFISLANKNAEKSLHQIPPQPKKKTCHQIPQMPGRTLTLLMMRTSWSQLSRFWPPLWLAPWPRATFGAAAPTSKRYHHDWGCETRRRRGRVSPWQLWFVGTSESSRLVRYIQKWILWEPYDVALGHCEKCCPMLIWEEFTESLLMELESRRCCWFFADARHTQLLSHFSTVR